MRLIDAGFLTALCKSIAAADFNKNAAPASWSEAYIGFIDNIEIAPTVEAEPVKRGEWIFKEGYLGSTYYCSECEKAVYLNKYGEPNLTNFCPDCGAYMKRG